MVGEHRFLGLLTSTAYSMSPRQIPLIDRKVERLIERAGFPPTGHAGKALSHIIETYPRDELLQTSDDELFEIAMGILHLEDRPRLRLFVRRDPFGRFVSCIVFVPRDRYNTAMRERMEALLRRALGATESEFQAQLSESKLARLLFTLHTPARCGRPRSTRRNSSAACSKCRAAGRIGCATRCWNPAARSRATSCSTSMVPPFPPRTRSGSTRAPRCRTSSASTASPATRPAISP